MEPDLIESAPDSSGGEEQAIETVLDKLGDFNDEGAAVEEQESTGDEPENGGPEQVTADQEKSEESEVEEGQDDPASPVIAPPDSWPAEARAKFSQLPSDLQAVIAEREREQKSAFNRQINEVAEAKKAAESGRQRLAQQLEYFTQNAAAFDPILAEGAKTDWAKLAQDDPALYVQKWAQFQQRVGQVNAAMAERQRFASETIKAAVEREQAALSEVLPEWRDEAKRREIARDLSETLSGRYNFTKEEISSIVDHRAIRVALDAARYHKLLAERKAVEGKKVVQIAKVQKPGTGGEANQSSAERVKAMKQRAAKTDNMHERAALIAAALD